MSELNEIANVSIEVGAQQVSAAGFGVPLILGPNGAFSDPVKSYGSMTEVAEDFETSDEEYIAASRIFGQSPKIPTLKIGKRTSAVAQVRTLTPTPASEALYSVTINGTVFSITSDDTPLATEIVAALIAAINMGSEPVTASGTSTLILTADVPGVPFTASQSSNLAAVATTANNGIVEDLEVINNFDPDWYGLIEVGHVEEEVFLAAGWIETQRKEFYTATDDSDVKTLGNTTNIAARLKAASYARTLCLFSDEENLYPDAALMGKIFAFDPGSYTAKFKTITGIAADGLTTSQRNAIKDKNCNTYTEVAGVPIISEGIMASGQFEDIIRFVDWLQARLEEAIYSALVNARKVPFTDAGIAIIENAIRGILQNGVTVGGLVSYTVSVPKAADVSGADKLARILNGVTFDGVLAGAIHKTTLTGTVHV